MSRSATASRRRPSTCARGSPATRAGTSRSRRTVSLDGLLVRPRSARLRGTLRIDGLPAGAHKLEFAPALYGPTRSGQAAFTLPAGETVEVVLSARVDPRRRAEMVQGPHLSRALA